MHNDRLGEGRALTLMTPSLRDQRQTSEGTSRIILSAKRRHGGGWVGDETEIWRSLLLKDHGMRTGRVLIRTNDELQHI